MSRKPTPFYSFSDAFREWSGQPFTWKQSKADYDKRLHVVLNSGNRRMIDFYIGFNYAKKGQEVLYKRLPLLFLLILRLLFSFSSTYE